jgi:hypothetical protein
MTLFGLSWLRNAYLSVLAARGIIGDQRGRGDWMIAKQRLNQQGTLNSQEPDGHAQR